MLDNIIERFADEYKYIVNIDAVVNYLQDECQKSIQEINKYLLAINIHNLNIHKKIEEDNKTQKRISKLVKPLISTDGSYKKGTTNKDEEEESTFLGNIDISYYIYLINNLIKETFSYDTITEILPAPIDPDFYFKINTILLHYKKEMLSLIKMKKSQDSELIKFVEEEETIKKTLIEYIMKYRDFNNKKEEKPNKEKINIVFDQSMCEADIDSISSEHYYDFYILLISLSKNILKGVKTFKPIGGNKFVSELRYNGARILFDKIDNDTYFVYYIFSKKDTDKYYHEKLVKRVNYYATEKKNMLIKFYNPSTRQEFLSENQQYYEDVINMLDKNCLEGENNYGKIKKQIK